MITLAELSCMNMYVFWMYIAINPQNLVQAVLTNKVCVQISETQGKNIQVFPLERPRSRQWGQLAALIQKELAGAQKGQGLCWQVGLRRQKG